MIVQVSEGLEVSPDRAPGDVMQTVDLVMIVHLNGGVDVPSKSAAVERLVAEIKKQFATVNSTRRSLVLDDLVLDQDAHRVTRGSKTLALTRMEFSLLEYLLLHPDRVVREKTLMDHFFNVDGEAKPLNTLWVHMHRLRKKIDHGHPRRLLYTIRGVGYVLRTPAKVFEEQAS
jgi:DNA-binding response OmpR family regulator